jgi:hypothetical protein
MQMPAQAPAAQGESYAAYRKAVPLVAAAIGAPVIHIVLMRTLRARVAGS